MPTVFDQSEKNCLKYCRHSKWIAGVNVKANSIKDNFEPFCFTFFLLLRRAISSWTLLNVRESIIAGWLFTT